MRFAVRSINRCLNRRLDRSPTRLAIRGRRPNYISIICQALNAVMEIDKRMAKMAPHLFDNVEVERRNCELREQRRWEALMDEIHSEAKRETPVPERRPAAVYRSEFEKR